jgi:predicted RecB family nuclease
MVNDIPTVADLAEIDPEAFHVGKRTRFRGIAPDMLARFQTRARLLKTPDARPYLTQTIQLPVSERELHFDIEVDPLRDHVYLHGFVARDPALTEPKFVSFVAEQPTPQSERQAFADAIRFFRNRQTPRFSCIRLTSERALSGAATAFPGCRAGGGDRGIVRSFRDRGPLRNRSIQCRVPYLGQVD